MNAKVTQTQAQAQQAQANAQANELAQLLALLGDEAVAVLKQLAAQKKAQQLLSEAQAAAKPLEALAKEHNITIQATVSPTETRVKILTPDQSAGAVRKAGAGAGELPAGLAGVKAVCRAADGSPILVYEDRQEQITWSELIKRLGWTSRANSNQVISRLKALGLWQG